MKIRHLYVIIKHDKILNNPTDPHSIWVTTDKEEAETMIRLHDCTIFKYNYSLLGVPNGVGKLWYTTPK